MSHGGQTVTLRSFTNGDTRDRLNQPEQDPTETTWSGVLFRPLRPSEVVTTTDVGTQVWRCTGAPIAAALAMTTTGELDYQGETFQITGVEPFSDFAGVVEHVRITCQRQVL